MFLTGFLKLVVLHHAFQLAALDGLEDLREGDEVGDRVLLLLLDILILLDILFSNQDLHAALTLCPEPVSLLDFVIVEVNLSDKHQPQGAQVEVLGIDLLSLLDVEAVGDHTLLLHNLS